MNGPDFAIVPIAEPLAADQPVPVGFLRISPTQVVDLAGFLRDTLTAMADNDIGGSHDCVMQQTVAASVAIETQRVLNLGLAAYMEHLCFPTPARDQVQQLVRDAAIEVVLADLHPDAVQQGATAGAPAAGETSLPAPLLKAIDARIREQLLEARRPGSWLFSTGTPGV